MIEVPSEIQIEIFLYNPTEEILATIDDKDLAMRLLIEQEESSIRLYFLRLRGSSYSKIDVIRMAVRDGDKEVFFKMMEEIDAKKYRYFLGQIIEHCVRYGRKDELIYVMKICNEFNKERLIEEASKGNHVDIIDYLCDGDRSKYWSRIAKGASFGGHRELLDDALKNIQCSLHSFVVEAARGGHREIVYDMMKRDNTDSYEWLEIAEGAAESGSEELLCDMVKRYDCDLEVVDCDDIACLAAKGGHLSIVKAMIDSRMESKWIVRGANNYTAIADFAAKNGHISIILYLKENGYDVESYQIAETAAEYGHSSIVKLMLEETPDQDLYYIKNIACSGMHRNIVELIFKIEGERMCKQNQLD